MEAGAFEEAKAVLGKAQHEENPHGNVVATTIGRKRINGPRGDSVTAKNTKPVPKPIRPPTKAQRSRTRIDSPMDLTRMERTGKP
jgi:hypothetical protein